MASTPIYDALAGVLRRLPPSLQLPENAYKWQPGVTPLSTAPAVFGFIAAYLIVIFSGREFMRNRPAFKLKGPFLVHNFYLTVGSGLLLAVMLEEILPIWHKYGFFHAICGTDAWTPRMEFFYILNFYTKFVELIDTIFLVLKKKPLAFLHVYHHSATAVLCYTQLEGKTSVSWVVICLNLAVHVMMYFYYFQTARGVKIWWKQYVTVFQIVQFVIDLHIVYFAAYSYFAAEYFAGSLPTMGSCAGKELAAWAGCAVLTSYLVLFIGFYQTTYKAKAKRARAASVSRGQPASAAKIGSAPFEAMQLNPTSKQAEKEGEMTNGKAK